MTLSAVRWISLSLVLCFALAQGVSAHLGSPWHGDGRSVALGFNTLYLEVPEGQTTATFQVTYPTQENTFDYRIGDTSTIIVFANDELEAQGFITEQSAVLAVDNGAYDPNFPNSYQFTIEKSGYYHVLFGPGPNTSILVLQSSRTVDVQPVSEGAVAREFLAPATSGDFHIIKHPTEGLARFAGWYSVFYAEFTDIYREEGLPIASDMDLVGERAKGFAAALVERGYPQFQSYEASDEIATSPFLSHVNGLKAEAFDTAFLMPGDYSFSYRPRDIPSTIIQTTEIVLRVFPDSTFDDGYGTEENVIAQGSYLADSDEYVLDFTIEEAGYYHLAYGVGEGGFLFQMTPDDSIPTNITAGSSADGGEVRSHTKLTGVNSVIVSEQPITAGEWSVYFPCKVVRQKDHGAPALSSVLVPFALETRLAVARLGSAAMYSATVRQLRSEIEMQKLQIEALEGR